MNLSPLAIIAIVAVFGGSFLLMLPIMMWNNKKKKKVADFSSENSHLAILHLYGDSPEIDGISIKKMQYMKGNDLEYIVALEPGKHNIIAKYTASEPGLGKNVNYSSEKIASDIVFEAGHQYTLSMYFYSPEQRANYYQGDVGETVYCETLDVSGGGIGTYNKAYLICYLEK